MLYDHFRLPSTHSHTIDLQVDKKTFEIHDGTRAFKFVDPDNGSDFWVKAANSVTANYGK